MKTILTIMFMIFGNGAPQRDGPYIFATDPNHPVIFETEEECEGLVEDQTDNWVSFIQQKHGTEKVKMMYRCEPYDPETRDAREPRT